jgi:hypothetical protein
MAYSVANPPALVSQGIGGFGKLWVYVSTDAQAAVDAAGYFSNGAALGMTIHDHVIAIDSDADPIASSIHMVNSAGATTDLNNGVAVTATDSD